MEEHSISCHGTTKSCTKHTCARISYREVDKLQIYAPINPDSISSQAGIFIEK
jgi:hypothetical protein